MQDDQNPSSLYSQASNLHTLSKLGASLVKMCHLLIFELLFRRRWREIFLPPTPPPLFLFYSYTSISIEQLLYNYVFCTNSIDIIPIFFFFLFTLGWWLDLQKRWTRTKLYNLGLCIIVEAISIAYLIAVSFLSHVLVILVSTCIFICIRLINFFNNIYIAIKILDKKALDWKVLLIHVWTYNCKT